ncbi:YhfZ family protein [Escherichia coli]
MRDALALYPFVRRPGSGLKAQFDGIPFYYAQCAARIFAWSVCLMACMTWRWLSRLAAEGTLTQKGLCLALELGPHTYVGEHQLNYRKGESANVKRVGLDNRSADQKIMTDVFFGGSDVGTSRSLLSREFTTHF